VKSTADLAHLITRARAVSAPLLGITTQDPASTQRLVMNHALESAATPVVTWDAAIGLHGANETGSHLLKEWNAAGILQPADALSLMQRLPEQSLAFFLNAHRSLEQPDVVQAIWNLRDPFKANGRTLVLLAPYLSLPAELSQDVLVVDEPLPQVTELEEILSATYQNANVEAPEPDVIRRCTHAASAMSAFAAEQAFSLSLRKSGMDFIELLQRQKQAVEQTRGLTFSIGGPGFISLGGLLQIRGFGAGLFAGPQPPRCIVRIDELEKQFAGTVQDSSGVSQDFSSVLLRCMQDYDWSGLIAVGPPGSGKSAFSKCLGGEFSVPTLEIDLGACKGSFVGESEASIRHMMRVIMSLSGESGAFFIGTCNSITSVSPEMRRRFRYGAWMFDVPSTEEQAPIWQMYLERFHLDFEQEKPLDSLWTGSDIYNCCELAYRLRCSLQEASRYLLPVATSAPEQIRQLRELADGRFLSASYPGPYCKPDDAITPAPLSGRRIDPC